MWVPGSPGSTEHPTRRLSTAQYFSCHTPSTWAPRSRSLSRGDNRRAHHAQQGRVSHSLDQPLQIILDKRRVRSASVVLTQIRGVESWTGRSIHFLETGLYDLFHRPDHPFPSVLSAID